MKWLDEAVFKYMDCEQEVGYRRGVVALVVVYIVGILAVWLLKTYLH